MQDIIAIVVSISSLAFSIYVHIENRKNSKQIEDQKTLLNQLRIENEIESRELKNKANLIAEISKTDIHYNDDLQIKNIGKCLAENVKVEILIDEEYKNHFSNLEIFPININSETKVKISYMKTINFPRTFKLKIQWKDQNKEYNEKIINLTP